MEWISFHDKFPEKTLREVLIFEILQHVDGRKIPIVNIEDVSNIHMDEDGIWTDSGGENLTHWMPLPEPPPIDNIHRPLEDIYKGPIIPTY
jgi:hypothetical protein